MEFPDMSTRAFVLASVLLPVLLSPAWAEEGPIATAPIPPAVKAAPDTPIHVAPKPSAPPAAQEKSPAIPSPPAAAALRSPQAPAKSVPKPAARVKEADGKKTPAGPTTKTAAKPGKADKRAEKTIEKNVSVSAKAAERRRWAMQREPRWAPPPPFGPSWYDRYDRGPMAYGPYGGGMRGPAPAPWDN
jgi:hypothetical protein